MFQVGVYAQNASITIGRGTDCFGRGACSISSESKNNYNASFIQNDDGTTTLRIFRNKINQSVENKIFGVPITVSNFDSLRFILDDSVEIDPNLKSFTAKKQSAQLDSLKAGSYRTRITSEFIDILISN